MSQAGIGLLGGTFDPVHCAHLRVARTARDALSLGSVLLIPAAEPPLKPDCHAPARHRLRMVELAVAGEPGLEASDLELARPGPSYTVATLRELRRARPEQPLWFLLGSDALAGIDAWHEPDEIFRLANLAVVERAEEKPESDAERPGGGSERDASGDDLARLLPDRFARRFRKGPHGWLHEAGRELRLLPFEPTPISSSAARERLRAGQPLTGWLPEPVIEYIRLHGLYQEDP